MLPRVVLILEDTLYVWNLSIVKARRAVLQQSNAFEESAHTTATASASYSSSFPSNQLVALRLHLFVVELLGSLPPQQSAARANSTNGDTKVLHSRTQDFINLWVFQMSQALQDFIEFQLWFASGLWFRQLIGCIFRREICFCVLLMSKISIVSVSYCVLFSR